MKTNSAAPERIVAAGIEGVGKTKAWAEIAAEYRRTDTPGHFYVLNPEPGKAKRLQDGYPDLFRNVTIFETRDWTSNVMASKEIRAKVTTDDWVVIETAGKPWMWVRDAYQNHKAKREGLEELDMFSTISLPELTGPEYAERMNPEYFRWIDPLLDDEVTPAHVFITAHTKPLRMPTGKPKEWVSSKDNIQIFGRFGVELDAQKQLAKQVPTVLLLNNPRLDSYTFTTIRDNERKKVEDAPLINFPMSYLCGIAGWET